LQQIELRRRAGYVSETAGLYEWMIARDFLKFISHFYPTWDEAHVEALLKDLGVDDSTKIYQLDPASKMKLRLIAALGHRPVLLLLDEPMRNQEIGIWLELHAFLKDMSRDQGVTIVISSEVSDSLDRLADRVIMLKRGTVLHCASSAALKSQYGLSSLEDVFVESAKKVPRVARHVNA
jgi:ABC-2 type transport system ATP-binding protein